MNSPRDDKRAPHKPGLLPPGWPFRIALTAWVLLLAIWAQFTVASVQEIEPQAATLGGIVVTILLVGGMTVWAMSVRRRDRDR